MKTRNIIFVIIIVASGFVFGSTQLFGQGCNWVWADGAGSSGNQISTSVSLDNKGNTYATGYFSGVSVTFGATTLTNVGSGTDDMYIVKYDPSGNVKWAKSAGGTNSDYALSVSSDSLGAAYVSGYFKSTTITFGATTLTNASAPNGDYFLVKYDTAGNVVWAINEVSSTSSNAMNSISASTSGCLYGVGQFESGSFKLGSTTLTNVNTPDEAVFVVKYTTAGNVIWAKSAGGNGNDNAYSVTTDTKGNIYLTGVFQSSNIIFGANTLTNTAPGTNDVFIVKYDSSGNILWAKSAGGIDDDYGLSASADNAGNVYLSGYFKSDTIKFGTFKLGNSGSTYGDYFLVKYDALGNVIWAKDEAPSLISNAMNSVSATNTGVYCVGQFESSSITFGTNNLSNPNSPDENMFIVKYDVLGNVIWALNSGGTGNDDPYGISADNKGNVVCSGYFESPTMPFGVNILNNTNSPNQDAFVARLYDSSAVTGIDEIKKGNICFFPNPSKGNVYLKYSGLSNKNAELLIIDMFGRNVGSYIIKGEKGLMNINETDEPNGVYYYEILSDKTILRGKFVISK